MSTNTTRSRASWHPITNLGGVALALAALSGCASSPSTVAPLGAKPSADATITAENADQAAPSGATVTVADATGATVLTPVAQPAPGPKPDEAAVAAAGPEANSASNPASKAPAFEVFDAARLRSLGAYLVETEGPATGSGAATADRYWTELLAQTLDESMSEMLPAASARADGVLVLRPAISGVAAPAQGSVDAPAHAGSFARASCRVELIDANDGRVLAIFSDGSTPARLSSDGGQAGGKADDQLARACVRSWGEQVAQRVDAARAE